MRIYAKENDSMTIFDFYLITLLQKAPVNLEPKVHLISKHNNVIN